MTLLGVRIATLSIAALGLLAAVVERQRVRSTLRTFFLEPSSAFNLGALRAVIFGMLCYAAEGADAAWFARLPPSLRQVPLGWRWLSGDVLFDPMLAARAQQVLLVASACAALGLLTRASAPIAALLAVYVLGMENFFVKINHGNHATVLCALALAGSPCGDALSVDRLWKRWRGYAPPRVGSEYTLPVRCCWIIFGTVYFFPGLWKLWESGDLWISGIKLQAEMYTKWGELPPQFEPFARIDQYPALLALFGTATLVFEIGFFFALFHRVTRVIAAFGAVGFHLGVAHFMGIRFHVYLPLVILFDAPQLGQLVRSHLPDTIGQQVDAWAVGVGAFFAQRRPRLSPSESARPFPQRSPWPGGTVAALVVCAQMAASAFAVVSWPLSIHPRFSRRTQVSTVVRSTRVVFEPRTGDPTQLAARMQRLGGARFTRLLQKLKRAKNGDKRRVQGHALVALFRNSGVAVEPGDHLAVYYTKSQLFPLGKRAGYKEKLAQRYEITDDYAVDLVK